MRVALATSGLLAALSPLAASELARYPLDGASMQQWRLPGRLREISGLALDADERLFAVDDESAVIYELDYESGRLKKAFALGDPVLRGDFEGIAIVAERFWLVSSDGDLYEAWEGADGEQVDYARHVTGLGRRCEVEGLAVDASGGRLLIACKEARDRSGEIGIHAWSIADGALDEAASLRLPLGAIMRAIGQTRFNPSGIELARDSGNLLVVAARQRAIAEVAADGSLVAARLLPLAQRHRQPEGIALARDGRLLIADEGGSHKARLAIYYPGDFGRGSAR